MVHHVILLYFDCIGTLYCYSPGPWRWYHEDMLDCCTSLQVAREKGINMEQFTCLAKCNNLTAVATSASDITSVDELRAQVVVIR